MSDYEPDSPDYYDCDPDPDYDCDSETCWHCFGAGGFHDCGEDCCPCAEPELNETCDECGGTGFL